MDQADLRGLVSRYEACLREHDLPHLPASTTRYHATQILIGRLDPVTEDLTGYSDAEWSMTLLAIGAEAIGRTLAVFPVGSAADYAAEPFTPSRLERVNKLSAIRDARNERMTARYRDYCSEISCDSSEEKQVHAGHFAVWSRERDWEHDTAGLQVANCTEYSAFCRTKVKEIATERGLSVRTWRFDVMLQDHSVLLIDRPDGDFRRGYLLDPWNLSIPADYADGHSFARSILPIDSESNEQLDAEDRAQAYGAAERERVRLWKDESEIEMLVSTDVATDSSTTYATERLADGSQRSIAVGVPSAFVDAKVQEGYQVERFRH